MRTGVRKCTFETRLERTHQEPFMQPDSSPVVFGYLDYRKYLRDWFDAKKLRNPRYSHRAFSRRTGQRSPSFLADVIKGAET